MSKRQTRIHIALFERLGKLVEIDVVLRRRTVKFALGIPEIEARGNLATRAPASFTIVEEKHGVFPLHHIRKLHASRLQTLGAMIMKYFPRFYLPPNMGADGPNSMVTSFRPPSQVACGKR